MAKAARPTPNALERESAQVGNRYSNCICVICTPSSLPDSRLQHYSSINPLTPYLSGPCKCTTYQTKEAMAAYSRGIGAAAP